MTTDCHLISSSRFVHVSTIMLVLRNILFTLSSRGPMIMLFSTGFSVFSSVR